MESMVLAIRRETPDTVTLRVRADMVVRPGQFVMLGAPILAEGRELKRSYSVAGYHRPYEHTAASIHAATLEHPVHLGEGGWVEVTIKEQPNGTFSRYVQTLVPSAPIAVYGPFGKYFVWDAATQDHGEHLLWIAGGSGIAPFRLMVQSAIAHGYVGHITLIFSVKTRADIIYHDEFAAWQQALPNLRILIALTRPTEDDVASWHGLFGRIGEKQLKEAMGGDVFGVRFYVCGPTAMVNDVQATLTRLAVPSEKIITEKYGAIEG